MPASRSSRRSGRRSSRSTATIVHGISHDDAKQALVEAFVSFGRRIGAHLLAEGHRAPGRPRRPDGASASSSDRATCSAARPRAARAAQVDILERELGRTDAAEERRAASPPRRRRTPRSRTIEGMTSPLPRPRPRLPRPTCASPPSPRSTPTAPRARPSSGTTVDGDEIVINSAVGRRWPTNLPRDPRISFAVIDAADGYRWVGLIGTVRIDHRPGDRPGRHRRDGPALPARRAGRGRAAHPTGSSARNGSRSGSGRPPSTTTSTMTPCR